MCVFVTWRWRWSKPVGNQAENQLSSSTGGGFTQTRHRTRGASYLSQSWGERGLGEKKDRRGSRRWQRTQLQYLLVLWWYMFFHGRKACHQRRPGPSRSFFFFTQTVDWLQTEATWATTRSHKIKREKRGVARSTGSTGTSLFSVWDSEGILREVQMTGIIHVQELPCFVQSSMWTWWPQHVSLRGLESPSHRRLCSE